MPPTKKHKKKGKKNKQKKNWEEPEEIKRAPHSIVIYRGSVGKYIEELMKDFRRVMEPNTASSLKVSDKNSIKDFVSVAGPLNVTHLIMFSRSEISPYLRLCRLPQGPTLTFKILDYSLARDVVSVQKRQHTYDKQFMTHPLVVLNNFAGESPQLKLMTSMFQNMFPSINIASVKLSTIRRCVLIHYFPEDGSVEFRHYSIKAVPVGVSKAVKRLVQSKVPNLANLNDISEFISKSGQMSDSEAEDEPASKVTLPQSLSSRGAKAGAKSAVRLVELGPRIRMQLLKIEEGLVEGEVLYHQFIVKTEQEKKLIRQRREQRRKDKEKARKIQDANRKRKEEEKEKLRGKALAGARRKQVSFAEKDDADVGGDDADDDDDAEWYRKEVGTEPEKDLFSSSTVRSNKSSLSGPAAKRAKIEKKKMQESAEARGKPKKVGRSASRDGGRSASREGGRSAFRDGGRSASRDGGGGDAKFAGAQRKGGRFKASSQRQGGKFKSAKKPGFKGASKVQRGKKRK